MKKTLAILGMTCLVSFAAQADELLVTPSATKGKQIVTTYAVDLVSSGDAVGFQFTFPLPKGVKPEQVNVRGCAADLPSGYNGQCNVAKGHVVGLFANDQNIPFPTGIVPLGKIVIEGAHSNRLDGVKFLVGDKNAKELPSSVTVVK